MNAKEQEQLKQSIVYEKNELEWLNILENTVYDEQENVIKFDLWNMCQSRADPEHER